MWRSSRRRVDRPVLASDRTTIVATVTHADGRHLERLEISRDSGSPRRRRLRTRAAAGDIELPPLSEKDMFPTKPYTPARDLFPRGWSPVFETVEELGLFAGGETGSVDVIGRHSWQAAAPTGRTAATAGSANYAYRRFAHAAMFGQFASTWRLEQRIESSVGELLRLERKRSAAFGVVFPWQTFRRATSVITSFQIEDRHRENAGDFSAVSAADPIQQDPTLVGGGLGLRFGNVQAGLRSISVQDGVADVRRDRLPQGDGGRSLAIGLGAGRVALSIVSLMDDVGTTGARGDRADRRTAGPRRRSSDRRWRGNNVDSRSRRFRLRGPRLSTRIRRGRRAVERADRDAPADRARQPRSWRAAVLSARLLSSWFVDSVGAASRVDRLGSPQLLSTGAELSSDITLFSFFSIRIRTGVGVPLKASGQ